MIILLNQDKNFVEFLTKNIEEIVITLTKFVSLITFYYHRGKLPLFYRLNRLKGEKNEWRFGLIAWNGHQQRP